MNDKHNITTVLAVLVLNVLPRHVNLTDSTPVLLVCILIHANILIAVMSIINKRVLEQC